MDVEDGAMRDYVQHFHKLDVLADASIGAHGPPAPGSTGIPHGGGSWQR
ncbi:hypothetical protein ACU4GD_16525 [Cupriavidus basilensis]